MKEMVYATEAEVMGLMKRKAFETIYIIDLPLDANSSFERFVSSVNTNDSVEKCKP